MPTIVAPGATVGCFTGIEHREPDAVATVCLTHPGNPNPYAGSIRVELHPAIGEIVQVHDSRLADVGEWIETNTFSLHIGTWTGLPASPAHPADHPPPTPLFIADDATFWPWHPWTDFARWPGKPAITIVLPVTGFADWGLDAPLDAEETVLLSVLRAPLRTLLAELATTATGPLLTAASAHLARLLAENINPPAAPSRWRTGYRFSLRRHRPTRPRPMSFPSYRSRYLPAMTLAQIQALPDKATPRHHRHRRHRATRPATPRRRRFLHGGATFYRTPLRGPAFGSPRRRLRRRDHRLFIQPSQLKQRYYIAVELLSPISFQARSSSSSTSRATRPARDLQ